MKGLVPPSSQPKQLPGSFVLVFVVRAGKANNRWRRAGLCAPAPASGGG
jgi:hypothetical protein